MGIDMSALRARLAASGAIVPPPIAAPTQLPVVIAPAVSSPVTALSIINGINGTAPSASANTTVSAPNTNDFNTLDIQAKIAELNTALLTAHPMMPTLLRTIHNQLRKDAELVTLLDETEIGIIVNCLKVQTHTELVTSVVKKAASTTKADKAKLAQLSLDDL